MRHVKESRLVIRFCLHTCENLMRCLRSRPLTPTAIAKTVNRSGSAAQRKLNLRLGDDDDDDDARHMLQDIAMVARKQKKKRTSIFDFKCVVTSIRSFEK